jgi:hypothetical protein
MANFQDFGVDVGDVVQVNAQEYEIHAMVTDDNNVTIADYTGANALKVSFGGVLATFSADQMNTLLLDNGLAQQIAAIKAGV